jgi:hypothetical protein
MPLELAVPAFAVSLVYFTVLFGVPEPIPLPGRRRDVVGFGQCIIGLILITSGLAFLRLEGLEGLEALESWWVYLLRVLRQPAR